jgi:hypothetical protein
MLAAAIANALNGDVQEAQRVTRRMQELGLPQRISDLRDSIPYRRPEDIARFLEGMRLAGLPE